MTTEHPRVDVIVLTWNDGALLDVAVESALASEGVSAQVVVIDNGSDPPARPRATTGVEVLRNEANVGVAAGRNQGVAATTAPFVCLLDSDAELDPACLREMVEAATTDPSIGVVVPVYSGQLPEHTAGRAPTLGRKLLRLANVSDRYAPMGDPLSPFWDVDFGIGACQLVRRSAFERVDGLDESYFYGPEDVDFCLRLRQTGWRVVQVRDARCEHPPRRRNRQLLTRRGWAHAGAVIRHLWRHRDDSHSGVDLEGAAR
jgi:GT2 family glycosyltransferase